MRRGKYRKSGDADIGVLLFAHDHCVVCPEAGRLAVPPTLTRWELVVAGVRVAAERLLNALGALSAFSKGVVRQGCAQRTRSDIAECKSLCLRLERGGRAS
jgi:hypothetical protein